MALLLEFFIAFFGVPWLIAKLAGQKMHRSADPRNSPYSRSLREFGERYTATDAEYEMASRFARTGHPPDEVRNYPALCGRTLTELIRDDMIFVYGQHPRVLEGGVFDPRKDVMFCGQGKYIAGNGFDLLTMLLLAKIGKIPPRPYFGSFLGKMSLRDNEKKLLHRIEQTLHSNGVGSQFVLDQTGWYFQHKHEVDLHDKKAW